MLDRIDERDRKKKLAKTVVKRWNVRYKSVDDEPELSPETASVNKEPEMSDEEKERLRAAEEIIARLKAEAAEDEAAKQAEIAAAKAGYNATTGAYSGGYGKNQEMNDSEREMVGNIMSERENALMETIQSAEDGIN
ncbi:MAG: hypothetical protein K5929_11245 [Lachnospiraceae bacterium]|nr:hypothetical protein [Lachnospiraceae bacterium]